jgi:hypothetical protein
MATNSRVGNVEINAGEGELGALEGLVCLFTSR